MTRNEKAIHEAIQDLKDSIFGMKQSFASMCMTSDSEYVADRDQERTTQFVEELISIAENTDCFTPKMLETVSLFFEVSIKFLLVACPKTDWLFQSIKKISNTVLKNASTEKSTFDVMVEDARIYIDEVFIDEADFWQPYQNFTTCIAAVDQSQFCLCVKRTLEQYTDIHCLNPIDNDELTKRIIDRLYRNSRQIQFELRKNLVEGITHERE